MLYYVLLAEVLLLIHDINRIALEKCLDVGGNLLIQALASLVGGAFIGLATPHIARLIIGTENHRRLLPVTMLMGAAIALLCNLFCTLPSDGGIIPLNAVTPLFGAPVIIYVLVKKRI